MQKAKTDISMRELLNEISELKTKKREFLNARRLLLKKRKTISGKIKQRIDIIKSLRGQRDVVVSKVKESKQKRQDVVSKIKENRARLNELKGELKQLGRPRNHKIIKKKIKALEWSFQTEPRPYEKEKKILNTIESMKEELKLSKRKNELIVQIRKLENENTELRKEQEAFHLAVVSKAKDSDATHEELKGVQEIINDLKKKLEPIDTKLDETRAKISEINNELSDRKIKLDAMRAKIEKKKEAEDKVELDKRLKEVKDKMSKRKKLSTEDILVLQAEEQI